MTLFFTDMSTDVFCLKPTSFSVSVKRKVYSLLKMSDKEALHSPVHQVYPGGLPSPHKELPS